MSTDRTDYYIRYVVYLFCSVVGILHGAFFLDDFKTDAWAMKAPWFNDVGIVCCYGLLIIGGIAFIISIVGLLVTFTTKPAEPEMTLEEERQLLADSKLSLESMTEKEKEEAKE